MIKKVKYKAEGKTAKEVMDFIKLAIGDDLPHEKFCGHGAHTWAESVSNALCASYIFVCKSGMISIADSDSKLYFQTHPYEEYKQTEKPRTKVVYEKVVFKKVTDIFAILESGEWLYTSKNGDSHIDLYLAMTREPCTMIDREFYRKVEEEIDWKEELSEMAGLVYEKSSDSFNMGGKYWDSGWVKEFGHLVASLTDKPE